MINRIRDIRKEKGRYRIRLVGLYLMGFAPVDVWFSGFSGSVNHRSRLVSVEFGGNGSSVLDTYTTQNRIWHEFRQAGAKIPSSKNKDAILRNRAIRRREWGG